MSRSVLRFALSTYLAALSSAAVIISVFACGLASTVQAQQPPRRRAAAPATRTTGAPPTPASVLGFKPGDDRRLADWRQITNYFTRLDAASERIQLRTLGQTTLGRPLVVAFISAPENIRNLAKYQDIQRRLADPRLNPVNVNANWGERLAREGKTVVVISCSIHSTEIVASQMSMQLAYDLASATDAETREILQNTILLLVPSANPDGVDIVANWYRKTLGTPYEGTEPPELYHHYAGHDNNRDWFMLNLEETKLLTRLFWREWFPQIVYDVHQQGTNGSRFFVPPFYDPPNPHIAPLLLREVGLIGHKIAADLQAEGQQGVITNALYDTWWHGGFRTAPYYHNSVGILTEAASARLMTPVDVNRDQLARSSTRGMTSALQSATNFPDPWPGGTWRARDIMRMELTASRAVLSMAAKYRERYLRNFYELSHNAIRDWLPPEPGEPEAYLIPAAGQQSKDALAKMLGALAEQGVEVYRMTNDLHVAYNEGAREKFEPTAAGGFLVFLQQPYRANVLALFERQTYPDRRTATGEAERPYDVAGWTLPMQMGVRVTPVYNIEEDHRDLARLRDEDEARYQLGLPVRQHAPKSPIANPLSRPVRLALYKSWTASMDEGWTRYVFDTFNVPFQTLLDKDVRAGNLRVRFDVIVLPSMRMREIVEGRSKDTAPPEYTGGITEAGVENLRRFVEEGGTLICFDAASELAVKRFNLPLRNVLEGVRSSEFYGPGSILRLEVDTAHPLARGFGKETDAYFIGSSAYELTGGDDKRVRVVARYADKDVLRSGWLLGEKFIAGKIALAEVALGKGRVVLFAFRPQHRAQTWGTFPFIWNAIELRDEGGGMRDE
ncbi:MAG TPA: M14 metallopeptidase family protein [Pyrinomonadaceae bacterium]|nr:M14 metallopeptidase family protein [Pyrinomonadaceae bacterium]